MSLYLVTDSEPLRWKELVEMSEDEAEHIREGGYTVELLKPITHPDFVVAHSPLTDRK